ncbi:hypothetical protein [Sandaracinus amylolyticus]|uniref:Uncharacterized protein n=1 Tax=Sandaracinus amylolyticus TaxID=927083 RepID=A0A0F6W205_9BACT|nr:hypothetical protein [Sandaracinus amylolyticus]AKF05265.1 hypothetical protein DB32_002414 [Sandaracinus amylolyticus]
MTPRLPSDDAREWLLDETATLVARAGWERFVLAPLVEPNDTFFPDRYVHAPEGVRTVARRLLRHAGIDDLDVRVIDVRPAERGHGGLLTPLTSVSFVEIDTHAAPTVDLELHELGDDVDVVPALAHEIARVFRAHRRIDRGAAHPYRGGAPEEEIHADHDAALASVAALYLGLGIVAANGALRYRARSEQIGRDARTEWVHDQLGGLDVVDVCFLLAVQLVVRGADETTIDRVRAQLGANQSSDVVAWIDELAGDADALRERLGVPAPRAWPAPWAPDVAPLRETDAGSARIVRPSELQRRDGQRRNEGRRTFRVRETKAAPWMGRGVGIGIVALAAGTAATGHAWPVLALPIAALVGWILGGRERDDFCSDPECGGRLPGDATTCAKCGGSIAGEIGSASERLAAEEALEDAELTHDDEDAAPHDEPFDDDDDDAPRARGARR